jgi:serine/threonine-protein kinase
MATDEITELEAESLGEEATAQDEEDGRRRIGAVLLAILVALAVLWWILTQTTVVPELAGLDRDQARRTLAEASLKIGDVTRVRTSQQVVGHVADQTPFAGSRVLRGTEVDVALAASASGLGEDGASGDDEDGDLVVPEDYEPGSSSAEQPEPRTYPEVSGAYVPNVQSLTEAAALSELRAAGYRTRVEYGPVTTGPAEGRVYFQEPEPNAPVARGTVVEIWVSTGGPGLPAYPYPVPLADE